MKCFNVNSFDVGELSCERNAADELRRKIRGCAATPAVLERQLLAFENSTEVPAVGSSEWF